MSRNLFGVHDFHQDWANMIRDAGREAWCIHTVAIGHDPGDMTGANFNQAPYLTPVVRINNGYGKGTGVIPVPSQYDNFAKRCGNFVAASTGIQYVVHANELGLEWEQPDDNPLTVSTYVDCYLKCYAAMKAANPSVLLAPQAPAPFNDRVPDAKDWIDQLTKMLDMIGNKLDWIALHSYARGYSQESFRTEAKMGAPYQHRYSGWEALYEYMDAIPSRLRHLPVIVTETNGDGPWPDNNSGWVQSMYAEIDRWNQQGRQQIVGAALFRWMRDDERWDISRHNGSVEDFKAALTHDYQPLVRQAHQPLAEAMVAGASSLRATTTLKARMTPGSEGKPAWDVVGAVAAGEAVTDMGHHEQRDHIHWSMVKTATGLICWVAEQLQDGEVTLIPT